MSSSQLNRPPFFSGELSDQAITAIAVVGITLWALLLVYQEHNINTSRAYGDARGHARETLIALQSYVIQVKEMAIHAEGYGLTDDRRYITKYLAARDQVEAQSKILDRQFAGLKTGKDVHRRLQELVTQKKVLINAMVDGPIDENAALGARQLLLLNKQQEFITVEEKKIERFLRTEIDLQDKNLKVYRKKFYATKHLIMVYSTLLVLASFGLVLKERRIRRRLLANGHN
jgi:hypothetical protein